MSNNASVLCLVNKYITKNFLHFSQTNKSFLETSLQLIRSCYFLIVRNCSFSQVSSFVLALFQFLLSIIEVVIILSLKKQIPVNLVPFFNGVSFLFYRFLKSGITDELKSLYLLKRKKVTVIYSKLGKTLVLVKRQFGQHIYGGLPQLHFFRKKRSIYELGSHFNQIPFI